MSIRINVYIIKLYLIFLTNFDKNGGKFKKPESDLFIYLYLTDMAENFDAENKNQPERKYVYFSSSLPKYLVIFKLLFTYFYDHIRCKPSLCYYNLFYSYHGIISIL